MHILKVAQTYYPYMAEGGRPAKVRGIARALVQRGHRVTVLTADLRTRDWKSRIKDWQVGRGKWEWQAKHEGVEAIYLPTVVRYRSITFNPEVVRFCLQRLRDFDLVHIYGLYDLLGLVVAWFCWRWGIPYVVEPMGMYKPIVRSLRKKRLYHRLLGQALVEGAACLIATSEQECRELIEEGVCPEKVVIRRNGLDLSEFENLPPQGAFRGELELSNKEPLVLYLGRLSRKKGLDLLLRVFASLEVPARLAIVGPDDRDGCVQELERLRVQFGLQDRVVLTGPRFGRQKLEALVDADLFVLPSQNENFGNAVAEAVACGVPVIVTDCCGIAPYIQDRVGLVVKYDEEEIQEAIYQLLVDKQLREKFIQNMVQVKKELSWEEPIREMEELYKSIVKTLQRGT